MRTRFAAVRTEPSSTVAALSALPIVRTSSIFPLYRNTEVRATTSKDFVFASALINSSVNPSLKSSAVLPGASLTKGKTATEAGSCVSPAAFVGTAPRGPRQNVQLATTPGTITTNRTDTINLRLSLRGGVRSLIKGGSLASGRTDRYRKTGV